jgi:predicted nuclease of predicted toxin-antitoxin system
MAAKISFYFDEHMPHPVANSLEQQDITVIMAIDVNMRGKDDDTEHLPFATQQGAILFTRDKPFAGRVAKHTDHAGLICWTGGQNDFSGMIRALSGFAEKHSPEEVAGRVFWLK